MTTQFYSCLFLLLFFIISAESFILNSESTQQVNNRPIIGILSQELVPGLYESYADRYHSYIAASYIKFVEGAGARAVPIWIGKDESYYEGIMNQINGVLWPGGDVNFNVSNGYADAGEIIYRIAKRFNDNEDYFPIFGICLGFELLTYLAANRVEHRTTCLSITQSIPLNFTNDYMESKMFKSTPENVINILQTENVTANYHGFCVTKSDLERVNLTDVFRVMSYNVDQHGLEFISTIEEKQYPFYGLQFHPEKNDYEWVRGRNIPHGTDATIIDQYFASFFIDEARKNFHKFTNEEEEMKALIYNYPTTYTGLHKSLMIQSYFFKSKK